MQESLQVHKGQDRHNNSSNHSHNQGRWSPRTFYEQRIGLFFFLFISHPPLFWVKIPKKKWERWSLRNWRDLRIVHIILWEKVKRNLNNHGPNKLQLRVFRLGYEIWKWEQGYSFQESFHKLRLNLIDFLTNVISHTHSHRSLYFLIVLVAFSISFWNL